MKMASRACGFWWFSACLGVLMGERTLSQSSFPLRSTIVVAGLDFLFCRTWSAISGNLWKLLAEGVLNRGTNFSGEVVCPLVLGLRGWLSDPEANPTEEVESVLPRKPCFESSVLLCCSFRFCCWDDVTRVAVLAVPWLDTSYPIAMSGQYSAFPVGDEKTDEERNLFDAAEEGEEEVAVTG